jgi:hypothetical protein
MKVDEKKPTLDYAVNAPPARRLAVIDLVLLSISAAVLLFAVIFVLCLV